jgi:hypothetical protein
LLLKATGAVAEVTKLKLALDGQRILVSFAGKRRKQYTNKPAAVLAFDGALNLPIVREGSIFGLPSWTDPVNKRNLSTGENGE